MPMIALDLEAFSSSFSTSLAGRYQILKSALLILELSSRITRGLRFSISGTCSDCRAFRISFTINVYFDGATEWRIYTLVLCLMRIFTEFLIRGVSEGYCELVPPVDIYRSVDTGLSQTFSVYPTNCPTNNPPLLDILVTFWPVQPPQFYIGPALIYRGREADSPT